MASPEPSESVFDREDALAIAASIEHVAKAWLSVPERLERAIELSSRRKALLSEVLKGSKAASDQVKELIKSRFGELDQTWVQAFGLPRKDPAGSLALGCPVPYVSEAIKQGISNLDESIRGLSLLGAGASVPDLSILRRISEETDRLVCLAKEEPAYYFAGSLYNILHGTLEQVSDACSSLLERLIANLEGTASLLSELHHAVLAKTTLEAQRALAASSPETALLSARTLRELASSLPRARRITPVHRQGGRADTLRIVAVDDEQIWRDFAREAASIVGDRLEGAMQVSFEAASNATEARELLLANRQGRRASELTIAIVDMGLPSDPKELEHAGRDVGQRLLRDLRRYSANIPCVVLTTPSNTVEDMARACAQGVGPKEYVLKTQSHSSLADAVLRLAAAAQQHTVLWDADSPDRSFELDRVKVTLDPMHFRTFCALCDLSAETRSLFLSREQILDRADELFSHEFDYAGEALSAPDQARIIARDRFWQLDGSPGWPGYREIERWMVAWHHIKAKHPDSLERALRSFASEYATCWDSCGALLTRYRSTHPRPEWTVDGKPQTHRDIAEFSAWFDQVYGGIKPLAERYDDGRFHDHFNEIREAIHVACQRAHRFVEPRSIVLSGPLPTGGYRVEASISTPFDSEDPEYESEEELDSESELAQRGPSILVVEDDPVMRDRLRDILARDGFSVRVAASIEEADPDALLPMPEIISLDLAIPESITGQEQPSIEKGLTLLKRFKAKEPKLIVLCPTSSADIDAIRAILVDQGVSLEHIIPKRPMPGHPDWMARLLASLNAIRNQRTRSVYSETETVRPIVELIEGTDMRSGKIRARVNGRDFKLKAGNQGRLLLWFLSNPGAVYEPRKIIRDFHLSGENALKQVIKNLRKKIQQEWLGIQDLGRNDEAARVLVFCDGAYYLNASVGFYTTEHASERT